MTTIAFFAPLLTTGGTQRHLQQVLALLDPARFRARVYTLNRGGDVEAALRAAGVAVASLDVGSWLGGPRALLGMGRAARALRREGVRVVHGYQWRPALVGTLVGRLAGVPLLLAGKRSLTGDDATARRAWRAIGRRVDTIVANAAALREESEAQGVRARWEIIPSGVDAARFRATAAAGEAKAALGLDPRRPVVGTVGRLEPRKGHDQLLAAAELLAAERDGRAPQVLLVGDGPLRARLEGQAAGSAARVTFTGALADVRPALAAMDVFVLPSLAEGMSNALLEAMAAGRPVVATAVGGTREVCEEGRTGVLVPPGDVPAMARAIGRLLAEPARAATLGSAGRRLVEARFDARAMVARLECFYEERLAALGRGMAA
ncbi:MAG TPA: glycosyltransferase [Candidatus Binatia bacterium]|nr:glycosyltransferase [Candidatus Binatia bacterium]